MKLKLSAVLAATVMSALLDSAIAASVGFDNYVSAQPITTWLNNFDQIGT